MLEKIVRGKSMKIQIHQRTEGVINYAALKCGLSCLEYVELVDVRDQKDVILRITAVPEFIHEYKEKISTADQDSLRIEPKLNANTEYYRKELMEGADGELHIELLDSNDQKEILDFLSVKVRVEPYLHWNAQYYPQLLPAFMQPNDPLVTAVVTRAGQYAEEQGVSMSAYQSGNAQDVAVQAECIYRALRDEQIGYVSSPAGFERSGQKIRIPHQILQDDYKSGTCLDLAVLYASCLEAVSIHSLLICIQGHAFAAFWTEKDTHLSQVIASSLEELTGNGNLVSVECTTFTKGSGIDFPGAVESGKVNLQELEYAVDTVAARDNNIQMAFTYTEAPICEVTETAEPEVMERDKTKPEEATSIPSVDMKPMVNETDRLTVLRRQAIGIHQRSALLKFPHGSDKYIELPTDASKLFQGEMNDQSLNNLIVREHTAGSGNLNAARRKLNNKLKRLYREVRQEKREIGYQSLYLSLNFLRWKCNGEMNDAPLFLRAMDISKNTRGEYVLTTRDGWVLNPVLEEKLRQDFEIDLSAVGGSSYNGCIKELRKQIELHEEWNIEENIFTIGRFQVPNRAIWESLSGDIQNHDIVRGILEGRMSWENRIQSDAKETALPVYVYPADSSQIDVIRAAEKRRALVVGGPAGNGKSQTIINIIANEIGKGHSVLFLSEKLSAHEVVHDMLEKIGMQDIALNLRGNIRIKEQVSAKLREMIEFVGVEPRDCRNSYEEYNRIAGNIIAYYDAINQKDDNHATFLQMLNEREQYPETTFVWNAAGKDLSEAIECVKQYVAMERKYTPDTCEFREFIRDASLNCLNGEFYIQKIEEAERKLESLMKQIGIMENALGWNTEGLCKKERISRMYGLAERFEDFLRKEPDISALNAQMDSWERKQQALGEQKNKICTQLRTLQENSINSRAYEAAKRELLDVLKRMGNIPQTGEILNGIENQLGYSKNNPEEVNRILERLLKIAESIDTEPGELQQYKRLQKEQAEFRSCEERFRMAGHSAGEEVKAFWDCYDGFSAAQNDLDDLLDDQERFKQEHPDCLKIEILRQWSAVWKNNNSCNEESYNRSVKALHELGLSGFEEWFSQLPNDRKTYQTAYEAVSRAWYDCRLRDRQNTMQNIEISDFEMQKLLSLQDELRRELVEKIRALQISKLPDMREGSDDLESGILIKLAYTAGSKNRSFFEQAPNIMKNMFPCVLADPIAAAECLPKNMHFDLVIIDEGSQMREYTALGAIAHAERCLIFGDEKQLKPTDFFQRRFEDEYGDLYPAESVLQAAMQAALPQRRLQYHYRSEQESLIAFANERYYQNGIVTFPSCHIRDDAVRYEYVEDGDYSDKRCNEPEAKRVIACVVEKYKQMDSTSRETVGIITLNVRQCELIRSLLNDSEDEKFAAWADEHVDVVNLESCQGKEWDYVFLSIVHMPDGKEAFGRTLGVLGREDGSNRLNVMLTRAKKQMTVVASFKPDQLADAEHGAKDLRDFLNFVINRNTCTGRAEVQYERHGITESVARILQKRGWTVHTHIGSGRVDIGVVSRENPEQYEMGILIDHPCTEYYTAMDQEVICPEALRSKGWEKIYHLRAKNWYSNPRAEIDTIVQKLSNDIRK